MADLSIGFSDSLNQLGDTSSLYLFVENHAKSDNMFNMSDVAKVRQLPSELLQGLKNVSQKLSIDIGMSI